MFQLLPGRRTLYRVVSLESPPSAEFLLEASRPDEGLSVELELRLRDHEGAELACGRVPLDRGYLAVVREVERQVEQAVGRAPSPDFELIAIDGAANGVRTGPGGEMRAQMR
jgi:hypothetical protein